VIEPYRPYILCVVVTPDYLLKANAPIQFEISEVEDAGPISLSVTLGPAAEKDELRRSVS